MKTLTMPIQLSFYHVYELLQIFQNHFRGDIPIIIRKVCLLYSNYEIDADRVFTILSLSVYELDCQKPDNVITKTCPCNMQQFLKVEKMIIFR